jgi:hypothetical protein
LFENPEDAKYNKRPLDADIHVNYIETLRNVAAKGYLDIVKYLIEHDAYICAFFDSPIYNAADNGHLDIVKYLV